MLEKAYHPFHVFLRTVIRRNALFLFYSNVSDKKKNTSSYSFLLLGHVLSQERIPNFWHNHKVKFIGSVSAAVVFLVITGSIMCCYKRG